MQTVKATDLRQSISASAETPLEAKLIVTDGRYEQWQQLFFSKLEKVSKLNWNDEGWSETDDHHILTFFLPATRTYIMLRFNVTMNGNYEFVDCVRQKSGQKPARLATAKGVSSRVPNIDNGDELISAIVADVAKDDAAPSNIDLSWGPLVKWMEDNKIDINPGLLNGGDDGTDTNPLTEPFVQEPLQGTVSGFTNSIVAALVKQGIPALACNIERRNREKVDFDSASGLAEVHFEVQLNNEFEFNPKLHDKAVVQACREVAATLKGRCMFDEHDYNALSDQLELQFSFSVM